MKKLVVVLLAVGLFGAMPVLAAEHEGMMMEHEGARQCALQAESIQQKIERIRGEIKKGSNNYSAEDLKKLEGKLKEANEILKNINSNP